jgi:thiol-disulfide isomerase/thioredoxin
MKNPFLRLSVAGLLTAALTTFEASAAQRVPFYPEDFKAAQAAGKPILVDIYASWCSVCRAQKQVIETLAKKPKYEALVIFELDYDQQIDTARDLGADMQSTLIAFHGKSETVRSVGDTDPSSLEKLLDTTLGQ